VPKVPEERREADESLPSYILSYNGRVIDIIRRFLIRLIHFLICLSSIDFRIISLVIAADFSSHCGVHLVSRQRPYNLLFFETIFAFSLFAHLHHDRIAR